MEDLTCGKFSIFHNDTLGCVLLENKFRGPKHKKFPCTQVRKTGIVSPRSSVAGAKYSYKNHYFFLNLALTFKKTNAIACTSLLLFKFPTLHHPICLTFSMFPMQPHTYINPPLPTKWKIELLSKLSTYPFHCNQAQQTLLLNQKPPTNLFRFQFRQDKIVRLNHHI